VGISSPEGEKTYIRALGLAGPPGGGVPTAIDVKDGKILRVRPLHFDSEYSREHIRPWSFKRNGIEFVSPVKSCPGSFSLAYKKRATSPNRIQYPMKRVDWDPDGERNPQNRGKSKFKRISWDEAASLVAREIMRVKETYGIEAILSQVDGHGENKYVHAPHGCQLLLLDKLGESTQQIRNPDSWEGWYWGAMHVWGTGSCGLMTPGDNILKDLTYNSELVLFWGADPETTPLGFGGGTFSRLWYYWTQVGIEQVYICPDLNYGAAIHADKWIPILPNTDAAMQLAIIYIWLTEGTYDKEYVETHTVGLDKVADYVLGKEDGIPKKPEWASAKCGVPEWTIKAAARQFAAKITSIAHIIGGGFIRGPFSHEPARLECIMLGMQGLGKPGVHQAALATGSTPRSATPPPPASAAESVAAAPDMGEDGDAHTLHSVRETAAAGEEADDGASIPMLPLSRWQDIAKILAGSRISRPHVATGGAFSKQTISKTLIQEAILNPPVKYWGTGAILAPVEDQFIEYTYPVEGCSEIHMIWSDTPCRTTCWNDGMKTVEAMRSPKIECVVVQHPWFENDTTIADIVLPSNTTFEVDDIVPNTMHGLDPSSVALQERAIPPLGESKSDYEVVLEVAKHLGMAEQVSEGKDVNEWIKLVYKGLGLAKDISWEDFQEKGYYVYPTAEGWEDDKAGLIDFYTDPVANPLPTPSGRLEFYSQRLADSFPDDYERQPIPKWVEKSESHDERWGSERAEKYPLLQISNHGRWRVHAQGDDIPWTREAVTGKIRGYDGYQYEPLWMNTQSAAERGIKNGDIVKVYNERGIVLGGAFVSERIMPGVVSMDHGSRCDWISAGEIDRGGAINLISPTKTVSKNCNGMASSGYLVEVEKVTEEQMQEWKVKYPEAFAREIDPGAGLVWDQWMVKED
jgi:trimethylamine-N-oxide reductase (cytochrome c)